MRAGKSRAIEDALDEGLKCLLDHVALDLAEEYVRLMEEAAEAEPALSAETSELANEG